MDELVQWLGEQLDEDERIARAACGSTVVGEPGNWKPAQDGDEWEASRTDCDEDELLVALRPGLPRPPDVMSGLWGAVVSLPEFDDPRESCLPQLQHAALHDPARVLREITAKRAILEEHEEENGICGTCVDIPWGYPTPGSDVLKKYPCRTLRLLAEPHSDRPGYREEWRP